MELKEISKLIDKITEKGITEFEMQQDDFRIHITKKAPEVVQTEVIRTPAAPAAPVEAAAAQPAPAAAEEKPATEPEDNHHKVLSPMVGTYYEAPSPGAKPYIKVGDQVKKGQVCCIVEAMKIMNEIQSDVDGVVTRIHVKNEQPVEFDEPLFSVDTN